MPCEKVDHLGPSGEVRATVCGGRRRRTCTYCTRAAEFLCDHQLSAGPRAGRTCDAPVCDRCRYRPAGTELDYCRAHAPLGGAQLQPPQEAPRG
jgi:hypothetical protein